MTASRHFDLLCFDWDGTLFDSTAVIAEALQSAVVDVGGRRPTLAAARHVIGMGMAAFARLAPDLDVAQRAEAQRRYRAHYAMHQDTLHLFEGILPMLRALKERGFLLAVATGKSRAGLDRLLAMPILHGVFDATRTSEETAEKPDPQMLLELMQECGSSADRTLMVGDTSYDLLAARNAGCASVGVSYGAHASADLQDAAPRYIAPSVADLTRWLREQG